MDNVRVSKLLGGGLHNSCIVRGMVLKSDAVGSIKRMEKAKVRSLSFVYAFDKVVLSELINVWAPMKYSFMAMSFLFLIA